jgi:hypothetical protein
MNTHQRIALIVCMVVVLMLLNLNSLVFAFGTELSRSSLRGLQGVSVGAVVNLEPEIEEKGLTLDKIEKDVELQLRAAGIKMLSGVEFLETKERPLLLVKVNTLKHETGYICSVIVQLCQHIYLIQKPQSETYPATTWSSDGVIGIVYAQEDIRSLVKNEADIFINAYLSENPK